MRSTRGLLGGAIAIAAGALTWAQGRTIGPEWTAAGADPQRTYWQPADPNISVENLSKPGFELQWTSKIDTRARQTNALTEGVTLNGVGLFWPVSLVAGASNTLYEIDNDTGNIQWMRQFEAALPSGSTAACPGGITAAPARVLPPPAPANALAGQRPGGAGAGPGGARGAGYRGAVGQPGEGVPMELSQRAGGGARGAAPAGAPGAPAAPGAEQARGAAAAGAGAGAAGPPGARGEVPGPPRGGGGGLGRIAGPGYVITSDGMLHTIGWQNGKDIQKPAPFLPSNSRFTDPIVVDNVAYASTTGNCGGAADGVWAIDLSSDTKPVTSFKTAGHPMGGVAIANDGRVIASIGRASGAAAAPGSSNAVVVLEPKTLKLKDWFSDASIDFASQPVVFTHNDKDVIAVATTNGRIVMLDAAAPGGPNHATPLSISQPIANARPDNLATWQDTNAQSGAAGTRWLLVPTANAVNAFKVVDENGKPALQSGWVSREIASASTPLIVNAVVFDVARGSRTSSAVLYALDGATGNEIWSSGKTITSFMPGRSFWSANSQVHVATLDGSVYAFGFLLERR
jgi:hypothetical protein